VKARLATPTYALFSGPGIAVVLLAGWCAPAIASSGVEVQCPEADNERQLTVAEIAAPSLTIEVAEHGVDSSAAIDDEIDEPKALAPVPMPAEYDDDSVGDKESSPPRIESLPTATRLPGVAESDLPRLRRQMFRTDI